MDELRIGPEDVSLETHDSFEFDLIIGDSLGRRIKTFNSSFALCSKEGELLFSIPIGGGWTYRDVTPDGRYILLHGNDLFFIVIDTKTHEAKRFASRLAGRFMRDECTFGPTGYIISYESNNIYLFSYTGPEIVMRIHKAPGFKVVALACFDTRIVMLVERERDLPNSFILTNIADFTNYEEICPFEYSVGIVTMKLVTPSLIYIQFVYRGMFFIDIITKQIRNDDSDIYYSNALPAVPSPDGKLLALFADTMPGKVLLIKPIESPLDDALHSVIGLEGLDDVIFVDQRPDSIVGQVDVDEKVLAISSNGEYIYVTSHVIHFHTPLTYPLRTFLSDRGWARIMSNGNIETHATWPAALAKTTDRDWIPKLKEAGLNELVIPVISVGDDKYIYRLARAIAQAVVTRNQ